LQKAVNLVSLLQQNLDSNLVMIGGRADLPFVEEVIRRLPHQQNIVNMVGKTTLQELVGLLASSSVVLTTDSGPAHVANAAGAQTVVLFGAGNERNTAPYNQSNRTIIRLGQLPCEPCVKNVCVLYGTPKCLELLDEHLIVNTVRKAVSEPL
jgi:ADP-heptose:LPS heptosyltransferase